MGDMGENLSVGRQFCDWSKASGGTSQVGNHSVESGPTSIQSQISSPKKVGHTSLKERVVAVLNSIKQFFTGRTERPVVSNPVPVFDPDIGDSEYFNPLCDDPLCDDEDTLGNDDDNLDVDKESGEGESVDDAATPAETPAPTPAPTETPSTSAAAPSTPAAETPAETPAPSTPSTPAAEAPAVETSTPAAEAPAPAPTPAQTETEAKAAGHQSAFLMVGETRVELCVESQDTLIEIIKTLDKPGLLDASAMTTKDSIEKFQTDFGKLDFPQKDINRSSGLCHILTAQQGFIGNENGTQKRPTPNAVRIAGAKAFAKTSSAIKHFGELATQHAHSFSSTKKDARKKILQEFINICNTPELKTTTLEDNIAGNNQGVGRGFFPLNRGIATFVGGFLKNEDNKFSRDELQKLAKDYGHEFVEQLVTTAYRTFPGKTNDRQELKAAYEAYCTQAGKKPTDLDGLVFNDELRKIRNEQKKGMQLIGAMKPEGLPEGGKEELIKQCQDNAEQRFQAWLSTHKTVENDDSVTIDLGHIKIMINASQLEKVTLKSVLTL